MATVTTFGVTSSDIAERLQNYTANSVSGPTSGQVDKIILGSAGIICSLLYSMGVADPSSVTTTHPIYQYCREYVIKRSTAEALRSRERNNPDLSNRLIDETDKLFDDLRNNPSMLTDLRPTGENAPNLNWSPANAAAEQYRLTLASQSQAVRNGAVYKV